MLHSEVELHLAERGVEPLQREVRRAQAGVELVVEERGPAAERGVEAPALAEAEDRPGARRHDLEVAIVIVQVGVDVDPSLSAEAEA